MYYGVCEKCLKYKIVFDINNLCYDCYLKEKKNQKTK